MRSIAAVVPLGVATLAAATVIAAAVHLAGHFRPSPLEREQRRRLRVNAKGRMTGAMVVDVCGHELHYRYTVGGAGYEAAQDVSVLRDLMPADPSGPAIVKYLPENPANSIVICEVWSGLVKKKGAASG